MIYDSNLLISLFYSAGTAAATTQNTCSMNPIHFTVIYAKHQWFPCLFNRLLLTGIKIFILRLRNNQINDFLQHSSLAWFTTPFHFFRDFSSLSHHHHQATSLIGVGDTRRDHLMWKKSHTSLTQSPKQKARFPWDSLSPLLWHLLYLPEVLGFVEPTNTKQAWLCWPLFV